MAESKFSGKWRSGQREYGPAHAGPIDILRHVMDANGLRQVDLVDVFGTASVIPEGLKGKRELSEVR